MGLLPIVAPFRLPIRRGVTRKDPEPLIGTSVRRYPRRILWTNLAELVVPNWLQHVAAVLEVGALRGVFGFCDGGVIRESCFGIAVQPAEQVRPNRVKQVIAL